MEVTRHLVDVLEEQYQPATEEQVDDLVRGRIINLETVEKFRNLQESEANEREEVNFVTDQPS